MPEATEADRDAWMRDGARKQRRWALLGSIAGGAAVIVILLVMFVISSNAVPAGDKRALGAVQAQGFSDVHLGGANLLKCAEDESSRHFTATNPAGTRVEGTVCCGISGVAKGCTLRW